MNHSNVIHWACAAGRHVTHHDLSFLAIRRAQPGAGFPTFPESSVTDLQRQAVALVQDRGYERREVPFKLASGQLSHDYVDGKYAVDTGERLMLVSRAVVELAEATGIDFDAVGGLTMGADALAHGVSIAKGCAWFAVRKEPKPRGREQWVEGCRLGEQSRVLLVDDVVSSGGSIQLAFERVQVTGAVVAGVIPMVDRGEQGAHWFAERGVPYVALMTYRDLGIEPVGGSALAAATR
jgi:orotate phosphoribosyltransferase